MKSLYDWNLNLIGSSNELSPIFDERTLIKEATLIPTDVKKFMDDAKDGVIYFNLDTMIKNSQIPKEKVRTFLGNLKSGFGLNLTIYLYKFIDFYRCIQVAQAAHCLEIRR